jgi:hypothetical protein
MKNYYADSVDTKEEENLINEATDLIYETSDKEYIRSIVRKLVEYFIGGHNSYIDVDDYLNISMKERWNESSQKILDHNNFGWSMCVKQLLEDMLDELDKSR